MEETPTQTTEKQNTVKSEPRLDRETLNRLTERVIDPTYLINGSGAYELVDRLKWQIDLNSKKKEVESTDDELEKMLIANLRGLVFERISYQFGVNSPNVVINFTTETSANLIQTARIESLQKVSRTLSTKREVIDTIAQNPEAKDKINSETTLPDGILIGKNDEIVGLMECKCLTPDEVSALARNSDEISSLALSLQKELKFLHELTILRWQTLGIAAEIYIDKKREQHNVGQPPIDKNTVVLLRFPAGSSADDLILIGKTLKSLGLAVEIQTIPITSTETDYIGQELLRSQAARINYQANVKPFSNKEIKLINKIARISRNDVSANLTEVLGETYSKEKAILELTANPI